MNYRLPFVRYPSKQKNTVEYPKHNVSVVYSLGIRCYTEIILKETGVTRFSSILGSTSMKSYERLMQCFDTNFKLLFDPQYLTFSRGNPSMETCNKERGFRTFHSLFDDPSNYYDATFSHHDLSDPLHQAHFARGLQRLDTLKNNNIPVLFVNISHSSEYCNIHNTDKFEESIRKMGFSNMKLLCIYIDKRAKVETLNYIGESRIVYTIPGNIGNELSEDARKVKEILNRHYSFDLLTIQQVDSMKTYSS